MLFPPFLIDFFDGFWGLMGCISSKHARSAKSQLPFDASSVTVGDNGGTILDSSLQIHSGRIGPLEKIREEPEKEEEEEEEEKEKEEESVNRRHGLFGSSRSLKKGGSLKRAPFSFRFGRLTESEHVAAGWPSWLSSVAGEVVEGWLPLRSDTFERLEKVINLLLIYPIPNFLYENGFDGSK